LSTAETDRIDRIYHGVVGALASIGLRMPEPRVTTGTPPPTGSSGAGRRGTERATRARMDIVYMLVIGLIVGALAKFAMPGRDPGGIIVTMIIGIAGSMLAGFIGREMHWYGNNQAAGFIASILGAMLLLLAYRVFLRRRSS
jgi:uncharacterized membrane protein YeaQ/YmgE (transglycosylase-associated protein family)